MAHQPKAYKKFVATAATATLVATAIVPVASAATNFKDVSKSYEAAVNYLVEKGIAKGTTETTFGTSNNISRGDAAVMIANALKLNTATAPDAGFQDVNARVAGAVNAIVEAGVASGKTATSFAPADYITRQEMAKMLANAYDLTAKENANFKDVNKNWIGFVSALKEAGITLGKTDTTFAPTDNLTRGEFALFMYRAEGIVTVPTVTSVSATNTTTLTVTGKGLQNLKAENLTVVGNTVTGVTPSAAGNSATVTFASAFVPDQEYSLVVKVDDKEETFKFKFTYDVSSVAVAAGTFDDDTKGQSLQLLVNGAAADYNALRVAGYTVNFVAVNSSNSDVSGAFFKNSPATTGALADTLTPGDYTVQVSVSKGSTVVVSEKQTIKVRNLELAASGVKSHVLNNASVGEQKSSTLVVGESATLDQITVTANGADFKVNDSTKYKVATSNPAVVSVSGKTLTANTPGTATITVTYGDVKRDFTVTVANAARQLSKLTPDTNSVAVVGIGAGKNATVTVSAVDQYGDLIGNQAFRVEVPSVVTGPATATTDAEGNVDVTVQGAAAGSGSVVLKSNGGTTLGSFGVRVTLQDNVASKRLEIVRPDTTYSADATLDLDNSNDNKVQYALNLYNSENLPNGTQDLTGYKVSYNANVVTIGTDRAGLQDKVAIGASNLTINAKAVGTTNVAVYDASNLLVGQFTVTVTNTGYAINSVNFKSVPTIDYKGKAITVRDVLDITSSSNDDIVKGITLNKASAHQIRIDETTAELYIDADGNGLYTSGEVKLGKVTAEVVTGATGGFPVGPITDVFTGVSTTASGEKGTVVFKVMTGSSYNTIKASTSVNVDVK